VGISARTREATPSSRPSRAGTIMIAAGACPATWTVVASG